MPFCTKCGKQLEVGEVCSCQSNQKPSAGVPNMASTNQNQGVQAGLNQPTFTQPGNPQPAAGQPGSTQPAAGQPTFTQPGSTQPAAGQPQFTQPNYNQPAAGQPQFTQPNYNQTTYNQTNASQSPYIQQNPAQPQFTQPNYNQNAGQSPYMQTQQNGMGGQKTETYIQNNKKKKKLPLLIGIIAAAVVVIGVACFFIFRGSGGKEAPLDKVCKVFNSQSEDVSDYVDALAPKFITSAFNDVISILKDNEEFEEKLDEVNKQLKSAYSQLGGTKLKLSYEVLEETALSKDEVEDLQDSYDYFIENYVVEILDEFEGIEDDEYDEIAESLGISKAKAKKLVSVLETAVKELKDLKITAAYTLNIQISMNGFGANIIPPIDVNVIKVNGEWMIDFVSLLQENNLDVDDLFDMGF